MSRGLEMRDLHIVSFSAVTWDFPLVGRTRMLAEAWGRSSQPTTFVQVPSIRTAIQRLRRHPGRSGAVEILRPWPTYPFTCWEGFETSRLLNAVRRSARDLRRQLERRVRLRDSIAIVVSPVWTRWLDTLPFRAVVYDCIDDAGIHVPVPGLEPLYRDWEKDLVRKSCAAAASATPLVDHLRSLRRDLPIATIRNGVDPGWIKRCEHADRRPHDLPSGRRPIVGFVGALYDWLDWTLVQSVAERLPDVDFVFVGPRSRRSRSDLLPRSSNVHLLGHRRYEDIPAYLRAFDVCWIPFKEDRITQAANPVKVYEYLAFGKRVVSTPLPDVESFQGFVSVGRSPAGIADVLSAELRSSPHDSRDRVSFAKANSWDARASEYLCFLESVCP